MATNLAIDPELLELFIEEAGELTDTAQARFPAWQSERDSEALADIRRQFHTLKGSGRMVGAEVIGEFAWSIENLLNRIIAGTVQSTDAIVSFVGKSIEALPSLVEQLESGAEPDIEVQAFIDQANAFAEARPEAEEMLVRTLAGEAVEEAEAEAALSLIQVEYEPLPVVETPQQALAEDAPMGRMPEGVSYEEAAAVPYGAGTALVWARGSAYDGDSAPGAARHRPAGSTPSPTPATNTEILWA